MIMTLLRAEQNQGMKILIVGAWFTMIYEEPLAKGFESLGHEVHKFKWSPYFKNAHLKHYQTEKLSKLKEIYYKVQNKYLFGPVIRDINTDLLHECSYFQPDLIFFYRATHIRKSTICRIKKITKALLVSYHNDDPFAVYNQRQSKNYIASLGMMDWSYVYREKNLHDVKKYTKNCDILLPYPNTDCIYPVKYAEKKYDVVFIGHYENDGRDKVICELIDDKEINFMLFGTDWEKSRLYSHIQHQLGDIKPVYQSDYNQTLNEAKIGLCFLSHLNSDKYTRRTFEIPASGALLLSQYTVESAKLLVPDEDAAYFRDSKDLLNKIKSYLLNDDERERVALNGYKKVVSGGHTYRDRAQQVLEQVVS